MSKSSLCATVENAISQVVHDFREHPDRFWNERDIHWSLFHYLQQQIVNETYPTQLIRAEFPTLKKFGDIKLARGHYDLVIINEKSYNSPEIQKMESDSPWQEYLELLQIDVAIEIKLWLYRMNPKNMAERIGWDIQKLTDKPNNIKDVYFLNFVQLDFKKDYARKYYQELQDYFVEQGLKFPNLKILCVPSDSSIHSNTYD